MIERLPSRVERFTVTIERLRMNYERLAKLMSEKADLQDLHLQNKKREDHRMASSRFNV
ncbi:hypothetical protein [Sporosarcina sp. P10]|uniref:hypothetical protein n=1 Tax=Sporosarcina sp. P10 TaxID=2048264 RepID=UPI001304414B|nr:hypothetical protein [Sporosarcina sp. P10]